ncbi:MAG: UDP-N-acetylmuramoyl-L-alanyl-D-glutamate--2,6-diaminopimelate ligase [Ruminococcaceae bacterium]|nr:UDP-N-acetylmuramoyl-L-alanyl-D-glutamate--2,6-diaminopimelate ligase [Oscillospiraceae bacterium]
MKLSQILEGCEIIGEYCDRDVAGISSDSRKAKVGDLFICHRGHRFDGHSFAKSAVDRGAAFVLTDHLMDGIDPERQIVTSDTRASESVVWNNFLGKPADSMIKIAVTGTAGKTTTAYVLRHIFRCAGYRVGIISTVKTLAQDHEITMGENGGSSVSDLAGAMTTPDPEYFFGAVAEMKKRGCEVLIYEASSQSLELKKTSAITPDIALFTNISPEHLDCHGNMEKYFAAKCALFEGVKKAVINCDDTVVSRLPEIFCECEFIRCSAEPTSVSSSDVCALRYLSRGSEGIEYVYFSDMAVFRMKSPMIGKYSVYNTILASAAAISFGVDPLTVKEAVGSFAGVEGRMKRVCVPEVFRPYPTVYIDYAHTAKALESTLSALREIAEGRLTVLFGCGGDRDRTKRPEMMKAAQKFADYTIVTSDNPRGEDPDEIIRDILRGADHTKPYIVIGDRRAAIKYAVDTSAENDVIFLAGKGHEKYEITGDGIRPFDEEELVKFAVREKYSIN